MAATIYGKHANRHLATFKEGTKSACLRNNRCTTMSLQDIDKSDDHNQGFHVKKAGRVGSNKSKDDHNALHLKHHEISADSITNGKLECSD